MQEKSTLFEEVAGELERASKLLAKVRSNQIRSNEHRAYFRSLAYAWFNNHRTVLHSAGYRTDDLDLQFNHILNLSERAGAKSTYVRALKDARGSLQLLRSAVFNTAPQSWDVAPDFSALVGNSEMRAILNRRWDECQRCVAAEAHLAAIVMMGGLLEAMFVARANKLVNKTPLINAQFAPKDRVSGKTLNYNDWMLDAYIKVARELGWISPVATQIADVLKEFRNYVHPAKELRHGVELAQGDSSVLWDVTKAIVKQLLKHAKAHP